MNKFEIAIQRICADFELEIEDPNSFNISRELKYNKELLKDIEILIELAFLMRRKIIRLVEKEETERKSSNITFEDIKWNI